LNIFDVKLMDEPLECASNELTTVVVYAMNWAWVTGKPMLEELVPYVV
jgi:hypothetical protein